MWPVDYHHSGVITPCSTFRSPSDPQFSLISAMSEHLSQKAYWHLHDKPISGDLKPGHRLNNRGMVEKNAGRLAM